MRWRQDSDDRVQQFKLVQDGEMLGDVRGSAVEPFLRF